MVDTWLHFGEELIWTMEGFAGGFFLPAQRSVHCRGGFFASTTQTDALAMQELDQIKDEFQLKQQRQQSAPTLAFPRESHPPPNRPSNQPSKTSITIPQEKLTLTQPTETSNQPPPASEAPRNLQSPRQRLQVAEMVMRKLYKKNLQSEQEVATLKAENAKLMQRLAELEKTLSLQPTTLALPAQVPTNQPIATSIPFLAHSVLANPPKMETINHIDEQQLDCLRHLAAEQDKTITALKIRIEELSTQLLETKDTRAAGPNGKRTPRQVVNRLQSRLQDALTESERQKSNYLKMKRDFQQLLTLKTKTLYENPAQLNSSAKELVQLMEKQMKLLEQEHSQYLSVYHSKLYEVEQQNCESYAQKRMMEEEIARIAQDVQQRDAVDEQIEKCMVNVFERLRQVEAENLQLKTHVLPTSSVPSSR
ncbi:hypothetical protein Poli38472_009586 [Pythium oligandrum]|uniref:Uncharacterized protein n=1 Tax=Pythium oligandrum TaxID=41045 RepID=A0A8K1CGI0_PYTOL|nr:hypothetical protein Poli38472_009586 [Pythium oligandrum]|eukprot:TMW62093.1 hypothetical protein Poli38472_009586 [Pythium oligandrum]